MVYKKIANKIPSLSSLLLAGVLLGTSDCGKKNKAEAEAEPKAPVVNDTNPSTTSEKKDTSKVVIDSDLAQAAFGIRKACIDEFNLNFLDKADVIFSLEPEDFKSPGGLPAMLLKLVRSFCGQSSAAYPISGKNLLSPLEKLEEGDFSNPCSFGYALNIIPKFARDFSLVYQEMVGISNRHEGDSACQNLKVKSIDPLIKSLDSNDPSCKFKNSFVFTDVGELKLIEDGPKLARFLSDFDKNGKKKQPASQPGNKHVKGKTEYGVPAILDHKCTEGVWLMRKDSNNISGDNTRTSIDNIEKRGSGLGKGTSAQPASGDTDDLLRVINTNSKINVFDNQAYLPYIPKLDNGGLTHKFESNVLTGLIPKYDKTTTDIKSALASKSPISVQPEHICLKTNVTFGTFLFTLFRGETNFDFFQLKKAANKKNDVSFKGNSQNYKSWIQKLGDDDSLAMNLCKHIERDDQLKNLFYIPNLKQLYSQFLPDSYFASIEKSSHANLASSTEPEGIELDSALEVVVKIILQKLGLTTINSSEYYKALEAIVELGNCPEYLNSDVTFEKHVCISIARAILAPANKKLLFATAPTPGLFMRNAVFMAKVQSAIREAAENAIVYKDELGKPKLTKVSRFLQEKLGDFNKKVEEKNKNAGVTYSDIQTILKNKSTSVQFDGIEKVAEAFQKEVTTLGMILEEQIEPLLLKDQPITQADFKEIVGLSGQAIAKMNEIKKSYKDKQKSKVNAAQAN